MSTTTIRLPDELKARVAQVAERHGTTAHSFMLDAIAEKADLAERRSDFHEAADHRDAAIAATGETIPWSEMRRHLEQRAAGKTAARPAARKLAR